MGGNRCRGGEGNACGKDDSWLDNSSKSETTCSFVSWGGMARDRGADTGWGFTHHSIQTATMDRLHYDYCNTCTHSSFALDAPMPLTYALGGPCIPLQALSLLPVPPSPAPPSLASPSLAPPSLEFPSLAPPR